MELKVFSIYDQKGKMYARPFFLPHKGQASRLFCDLVEDNRSEVSKHPEDYTLYQIGNYDDNIGRFENLEVHELIAHATEFKNIKASTKEVKDETEVQKPLPISEAVRSSVSGTNED